jgi:hypothetical protein
MLGLHEEFLEVKRPDSQVGIFAAENTECVVDSNGEDGTIVGFIRSFQGLVLIVYLEHHSMFASHKDSFQTLVLRSIGRSETIFEIKTCEHGVSGMMLKYNSRASDVASLSDPPKSDVLLSTGCESRRIDGTEFEAQDVEL